MIILRECRYSFISDVRYSGLKRSLKKKIGNVRSDIANNLTKKYIDNPTKKASDLFMKNEISSEKVVNPLLEKKLLREAGKRNARVISGIQDLSTFDLSYGDNRKGLIKIGKDAEELSSFFPEDKSGKRLNNKIRNILKNKNNKYIIGYSPNTDIAGLAHEIGHVDNKENGSVLRKFINKVSNNPELREDVFNSSTDKSSGIMSGIKRYFKSRALIKEESNASKKALDLLKKSGATKEEIIRSKNDLNNALSTYKSAGDNYYRTPLINKLQIPSRRSSLSERFQKNIKHL